MHLTADVTVDQEDDIQDPSLTKKVGCPWFVLGAFIFSLGSDSTGEDQEQSSGDQEDQKKERRGKPRRGRGR